MRIPLAVAALLLAAACATAPGAGLVTTLDPKTAVTLQAMGEPWIYARDATALAVNARDYVSLGVVEVNRMGQRRYFLGAVSWSTVDRSGLRDVVAPRPAELRVEGRATTLTPLGNESPAIGVSERLFRPPSGYLGETWYALAPTDVRTLGEHVPAWIEFASGETKLRYELWRGGPQLIAPLVEQIP